MWASPTENRIGKFQFWSSSALHLCLPFPCWKTFTPLRAESTDRYEIGETTSITHHASWLELLPLFTTVKNLYLSEASASCIMPTLQELIVGRMTEVLPDLAEYFLGGASALQPSDLSRKTLGSSLLRDSSLR